MKRPWVIVTIAALLGYGALALLAGMVIQQQSELRSIESRLSTVAAVTPSPPKSPGPATAFAQIKTVTDNFGHTWVLSAVSPPTLSLPVKSNVTFTAVGRDEVYPTGVPNPVNRPIEYTFIANSATPLPGVTVVCAWGGASCTWTAPAAPQPVAIRVFARIKGAPHRLAGCGLVPEDSCDSSIDLFFQIVSSPTPGP